MSKYIDADALIEKIINTPSKVARTVKTAGMLTKLADRQFEILNLIEKMPAADVEPVLRWISVDERLPEEPYSCLAAVKETDCDTSEDYLDVFPVLVGYDGETWNDYDGQEIPFEVEAWLKVPEPPKMDGGSE